MPGERISVVVAGIVVLVSVHAHAIAGEPCKPRVAMRRAVAAVLAGDRVLLDDRSEVRLIGILAPNPPPGGAEATWPPAREARAALAALVEGASVALAFAGPKTDRFGRLRAHLLLETPGQDRRLVAGELVATGHARVEPSGEAGACTAELLAKEQAARKSKFGLWRHAAYQIRPAKLARALLKYENSFEIVEGEIAMAAERKRRVYLNFGQRWKEDFTLLVSGRALERFKKAGIALGALQGKRVRVRGFIEDWNGPLLRLNHPDELEIIDAGPAPESAKSMSAVETKAAR